MDQTLSMQDYVGQSRLQKWGDSLLKHVLVVLLDSTDENWCHDLLFRIGAEWAADAAGELRADMGLDEIQLELNDRWGELDWGWMSFDEGHFGVEVSHRQGPFVELFGLERVLFATELMRGFYSELLRIISDSDDLVLELDESRSNVEHFVFVLRGSGG
jgi:hypothetical protein